MRKKHRTYIVVTLLTAICMLVASCSKDPVFEQGDYIYEYEDFTKIDNINGILIHWSDSMNISDGQKTVIRNLVANLVWVDGGTFQMGAQHTDALGGNYDAEAWDDENPVHEVALGGFYIGKYEITQREWCAVMGYDLDWSEQYGKGNNYPAYNVSRTDAIRFMERLGAMTRLPFQLPTEAQWEYAARGGKQSQYYRYSGSNDVDAVAWHKENANSRVHFVGAKQTNELGLYDMSGNLWEWCLDSYNPYSDAPQTDPVSETGNKYVLRGGAWTYFPTYCRVSCRDEYSGNSRSVSNGFRIIMNDEQF